MKVPDSDDTRLVLSSVRCWRAAIGCSRPGVHGALAGYFGAAAGLSHGPTEVIFALSEKRFLLGAALLACYYSIAISA